MVEQDATLTGRELRAARVKYGIRAADIAQQLGVSAERVRIIERSVLPTARAGARYRHGLEQALKK